MVLAMVSLVLLSPLALAANGGGPDSEAIAGHVYDEMGLPKEGAQVRVEGTTLVVSTDEAGRFVLTGTNLDGEGQIIVSADGYMTVHIP